jgi:hypothetical protein
MFSYASEICIRKAQSFQRSDFDAEILRELWSGYPMHCVRGGERVFVRPWDPNRLFA